MLVNLSTNKSIMLLSATLVVVSLFLYGTQSFNMAIAQAPEKITLKVSSATLTPLKKTPGLDQVKVIVDYTVNDPSVVHTQINGVMHVMAPNGTSIKASSFPSGFTIGQSGQIQFATSIHGDSLNNVKAEVVLTDLAKTKGTFLSNRVSTNITLSH